MKILSDKEIPLAASLIKGGDLVVFPTETVYGLGADVFNREAIKKIYRIKNRPIDNPLIAHIAAFEQMTFIARDIPHAWFEPLAEAFMPGPLTVLLKKHPNIPYEATAGLDTIAVRFPDHPIAQELILESKTALVAPSANLSGRPSSTKLEHVIRDFQGLVPAVIDGGPCLIGIESTVIDLTGELPCILRPGSISAEQIKEVLGVSVDQIDPQVKTKRSPGMKYRHYSPDVPVKAFFDWNHLLLYLQQNPSKKMVLSSSAMEGDFDWFKLSSDQLYAHLRFAEDKGYEEILLWCDESIEKQAGLMNRISHICQLE